MAKGDYYFPLFYKRLLTSTIGWKDDEFGAYVRLLIHQFDNGSIPEDMDELKRIAPSIKKHWPLVSKKFHSDGNGNLVNDVMTDVIADSEKKKQRAKENGSFGGRPKKPIGFNENKKSEKKSEKNFNNEDHRNKKNISALKNSNVDNHSSYDKNKNLQVISGFSKQNQNESYPITNNKESIEIEYYSIEHCIVVALNDSRWVKANHTHEKELKEFNSLLEKRGIYEKNPQDYKNHFANWKRLGKKDIQETEQKTSFNPALKNRIS